MDTNPFMPDEAEKKQFPTQDEAFIGIIPGQNRRVAYTPHKFQPNQISCLISWLRP